jgi:creatinine amidohydrolase
LVPALAWDEVARRLAAGAPAILPVGAGAKQHGLHLPMGTDAWQAEALALRLAREIGGLVWPVLGYGYYPAFVAYPGSVSLSRATCEAIVRELADGLFQQGARTVLVLNTGLSTIAPIDAALASLPRREQVAHLQVHSGPRYRAAAARLARQGHGSHADELETSLMLALAPELVDMPRAAASPHLPAGPQPGPLTPIDPASPNYAPSGSFGDPTLATRDKGGELLAAMLADLVEAARAAVARSRLAHGQAGATGLG